MVMRSAVQLACEDSRFRRQDLIVYRVPINVPHSQDELISGHDVIAVEPRQQCVSAEFTPKTSADRATSDAAYGNACGN